MMGLSVVFESRYTIARSLAAALFLVLGAPDVALPAHPKLTPPDLNSLQWNLHNEGQTGGKVDADIDAPEAWWITTGRSDIVIAVIDSGIDVGHDEFVGRLWINPDETENGIDDDGNGYADDIHGWNFTKEGLGNADISDNFGHGSAVSSIIAAEAGLNNGGMAGICWRCRIMVLKVTDHTQVEGNVEKAIRYAIAKGADVINLSLGDPMDHDDWRNAIQDAVEAGIVVVAAAGNKNVEHPEFPSRLPKVITVGATDSNDRRWQEDSNSGSNFGLDLDLMAPGEKLKIFAAGPAGTYVNFGETSAATPHVSGAAALLLSLDKSLSPEDIQTALVTTTDTGIGTNVDPSTPAEPDSYYIGAGRLNLFKALSRVAFSDVKFHDWFNPYVAHAFQEEVINGFSDWTFHPADPTTRAEVLRMAYAAAGESITIQNPSSSGFADVQPSDWFFSLVADAGQNSYIQGELCNFPSTAPCFFPNRPVTRAEALKIISALFKVSPSPSGIAKVINVPLSQQPTFPDVPASAWFYPYVQWMSSAELTAERLPSGIQSSERLVSGYPDGFFRPENLVNRAEMAKIVVNTMLYCRTGPNPHNCNTNTAALSSPSTVALTTTAPVSIGASYEQQINPLNQHAPSPFHLPGGDEQIVSSPIPLSGDLRDADGDLLFYFWSASGGSFTTSDPVNFSSVTWTPPSVTKDTLFTVDVVRGDRRGLVGRGSFRFLVPGASSNQPGSGTITGPNGTQTGAVTLSATASDADGLARVFITFTPTGPAVALCGTGAAAACSGTSGTWSRSGVDPAAYGTSAGTVNLSLFVEDAAGDVRFVDSHSFTFSPPPSGPTFRLTVLKQGDGSGTVSGNGLTCGPSCSSTSLDLPQGTAVTLTGAAAAGSVFVGFGGDPCYGVDPCTFTLFQDRTVRAAFGLPDAFALGFTSPANGDTGVAVTAQVNAFFNRDILPGPNYGSLALRESGGTPVPFTPVVRSTDRRLVLIPSSTLVAGRSYVVDIPAGAVSDTQGTPLATPTSFLFTTAAAGTPKMYIAAYPTTVMEGSSTKVSIWFETPSAQDRTVRLTSTPAGELIHPSEVIVPAGGVLVEFQMSTRNNAGSTSPVTATLSASEASAGQQSLPIVIANETNVTGASLKFQAGGIISDTDGDGVLESGEQAQIRFDVANFGSSSIFNVHLDFAVLSSPYLSILGGTPFSCDIGALGAGRNGNCTKSVLAHSDLPTADYFIEVRGTSSANGILDQVRIPVVNRLLPDFILNASSLTSADLQPGQTVELKYTPRNDTDGFSELLPLFEVTMEIEGTERLLYRTYANARGYFWNDQTFRLPIVVPPVPGIHPIRARINPPGTGRIQESNFTNNDATVLYLHVAAPNQAPVLSPIPSPVAAKVGRALTFTVSATDANSDPVSYRLGPDAPAGATLNATSGVFSWTPQCGQGPGSYTFTVIAADGKGGEDAETVTVQAGLEADLEVTQAAGSDLTTPGEAVGLTIQIVNRGPSCITGARLTDAFPASLTGIHWTCTATPGSSCAAVGNGSINDGSLALVSGGTVTYAVTATLSAFAQDVVANTATVTLPASATDPDGADNSASASITLRGMDFGDAPESGSTWRFPTVLSSDGARHGIYPDLRLGAAIDAETDGQASPGANGDDAAGSRDEDGVVLTAPLVPCQTAQVQVTASAPGNLYAWIDFNTDGDWDDAGEAAVAQRALAAGVNDISFAVPCGATSGGTAMGRFRFSTAVGLGPQGLAPDGEVEDHALPIAQVFHRLTVARTGTGTGTVTASPGGIDCGTDCLEDYPAGSIVTLAATPASGSLFTGWTGAGCTGNSLCVVTLDQARQVTAVFEPYQNEIFEDGFESGNTSDWSGNIPPDLR
jgi:uncharacterized repeat protein (TIGR01451 family)